MNHKQTFRHEFGGGYIWSPKRRRNVFYDFIQMVRPGEVVFSYAGSRIRGAGVAKTHCYTSPRPDEFGRIGKAWDAIGWRVDVAFTPAENPVEPREMLSEIADFAAGRRSARACRASPRRGSLRWQASNRAVPPSAQVGPRDHERRR